MVEEGKISAEQALKLIRALESSATESDHLTPSSSTIESGPGTEKPKSPEFEEIAFKAQRLWQILLWVGVSVVVLSAYWLYSLVIASNYGFWFYCALLPLLFGVLFLALFTGSRNSRWFYVNVEQSQNEWPRNITIGLPLPLGLASWFLRNFGNTIEGLNQTAVDAILEFLSKGFSSKEPLIVNVNEGSGGERVQVYIG
jgi:hypothetical protein